MCHVIKIKQGSNLWSKAVKLPSPTRNSTQKLNLHCLDHFFINTNSIYTHAYKDPTLASYESQLLRFLSGRRLLDARNLLDKMPKRGLTRVFYWTSLLTKYVNNGFFDEARLLFDVMPDRNVVTWNAMLGGYLKFGRLSEGRRLFDAMPERNVVSWTCMVSGLARGGRILEAMDLFEVMPERNVVSWNVMVVALVRFGDLEGARCVFDSMPVKNVVSWNTMIGGYVESCMVEEARALFDMMEGRNVVTWTSMVSGYCRVGELEEGYRLFRLMPEKNIVSWTTMIGGFAWNGLYKEALSLFVEMKRNIKPNGETFISLAYACAGTGFAFLAKQLHCQLVVNGLEADDYDGRLLKSLIHMYSSLGIMKFARYIFNKNSNNYVVQSCNNMINGYIRIGQLEEARNLFDTLQVRDKVTWTLMIDGYFGGGDVSEACYLFGNIPEKDSVAWTCMISGLVQNELFAKAAQFFAEMRSQGVPSLNSAYAVLFGAAGAMAHIDYGRQLHCLLIKTKPDIDVTLDNSLISMYAKCGEIYDAHKIFSNMTSRDPVSWNSMIMGFSHHGLGTEALRIFEEMLESGTHPNSVTFLGILSACSHAGLVDRGFELFNAMSSVYGTQPSLEHYISMINLLGRAGKVKEAEDLVLRMPIYPDLTVWGALLGVCGFNERNADVAKRAARRVLDLDPTNGPAHVALCNSYAANGQHLEEQKLRKDMGFKGVKKVPGCSWIHVSGLLHVFLSGDKLHSAVYELLSFLFGSHLVSDVECLEALGVCHWH